MGGDKDAGKVPYKNPRLTAKDNLLKELTEELKKDYPYPLPSVEVKRIGGRLYVRLYGQDDKEWRSVRTKSGKLRSFSKDLKDALGDSVEEIIVKIRKNVKKLLPDISDDVEVRQLDNKYFQIWIDDENGWIDLQNKNRTVKKILLRKYRGLLGFTTEEKITRNQEEIDLNK